jgi:hypothetical protein
MTQVLGVSGKERAGTVLVKDYANNSQRIGAALWLAINTRTKLYLWRPGIPNTQQEA